MMSDVVAATLISCIVMLIGFAIIVAYLGHRITELKFSTSGFEAKLGAVATVQDKQSEKLDDVTTAQERQSEELRLIARLTRMLVSKYQRDHLTNLRSERWETPIHRALILELSYLLALGLVDRKPGYGIRSLEEKERQHEATDDVCLHLCITDRGRKCLAMVEDFEKRRLGDEIE